jgi:cytochrome c biogenesis protein CcdA
MTTLLAAVLAGILSVLSPCVLPIVPIVVAAAASAHRFGPLALAAGLAISFTAIGLFVAAAGFAVGIDSGVVRSVGGVAMIAVGLVLLVPALQAQMATAAGPASAWLNDRFSGAAPSGLAGQFGIGALMGLVWAPCVGPTLGAAIVLASTGEGLVQAGATMFAFGLGAAIPLLLVATFWRGWATRNRERLLAVGSGMKQAMGGVFLLVGALVVSGLDKRLEAMLVAASPDWLTRLTTAY